ncbi:MAG: lipopolysaccharide biosynthesis protein, partial [Desulfuromonadales bacterium]|nr:lipopolysaccharide biosynthesis protein [Desulfuromonadales bacterium]
MLKDKVLRALAWQSGAKIVTQLFSFLVTIILARNLLPEDYGVVGMALVFTGLISLINELGIGSSIIRDQNTTEEQLSSVFWFALCVSIVLFCATFFLAPLIGQIYRNEQVVMVVRVLAINLIIGAFRTVPFSLLTRELKFDKRSKAEVLSAFAGGTTALVMAFSGFGVWSLVFNAIANSIGLVVLSFYFSQWRPMASFRFSQAKDMVNFGAKIMGSRIQWYAYSNADFFIIGRLLGKEMLGYYTMAFTLASFVTEKITAVVNQVTFPTFSKLQNDVERLQEAFLKATKYVSMLTFPAITIIAILAEEIVITLLTQKWLPIVFPLRILCLVGFIRSVDVILPQALVAKGKAGLVLKYTSLL